MTALQACQRHGAEGDCYVGWAAGDLGNIAADGLGPSEPHPDKPGRWIPSIDPDPDAPGLMPPEWADLVVLLGDGDSDPLVTRARLECARRRYEAAGFRTVIAMAPDGADFNDLVARGGRRMRQGADRSALKERRDDLYETPACATLTLMRVEPLPHRIWEPAAGRGAIARELEAAGHHVLKSDLVAHSGADDGVVTPVDFLLEPRSSLLADVEAIVSNPPYKNADEFIRRGIFHFQLTTIVLLRLMALEGANRSDLVDRHLVRVWAGIERLPKFQREGWTGPKTNSETSPFAWFVFSPEDRGSEPIAFRRMSWRGLIMTDEPPSLKPVADTIIGAIATADASPANVVPIDRANAKAAAGASRARPNRARRRRLLRRGHQSRSRPRHHGLQGRRRQRKRRRPDRGSAACADDQRLRPLVWQQVHRSSRPKRRREKRHLRARLGRHPDRRQYSGIEFHPDPHNAPGTPDYLNLWCGFAVTPKPKANGWKTFRDHLLVNVCAGDESLFDWVMGFFAHIVQRPRERIGVALVLQSGQGTGKTIVGHHFGALFPAHYFLVDDPRYVVGNFNVHMANCLLLQADEAVWAGDKAAAGRLKGLITSPFQQIEAKGIDPIRMNNFVRLVMTSNERWVVPAGMDERRFAVLEVDPRCAGDHDYFHEMQAELNDGGYAALLHDLLAFDLERINLRTIPKTTALLAQKERELDPIGAWWLDRLTAGSPAPRRRGMGAACPLQDAV